MSRSANAFEVGPGCIVQRGARVGADTRLIARVNLYAGVQIGARCILHAGAVIGADGFGFASDRGSWVKVPQVGSVRVGDDVEIGANTTIDRGAIEDTVVEAWRQTGQSDTGRPQRGHRRAHRHRRVHGDIGQHHAWASAA